MLKIGIIGLPNAGKSSLYNLLTGASALMGPYPFTTVEPNKSALKLVDRSLAELAHAIQAPDIQYSPVELWDIAGLIEGASEGEGLGSEFLGQINNCDVLIHVVRITQNSTIEEAKANIATVAKELALFDHKNLLKKFEKARRMVRLYPKEKDHIAANKIYTKAFYGTKGGSRVQDVLDEQELALIADDNLISSKPTLIISNADSSSNSIEIAKKIQAQTCTDVIELLALSTLSEEELKELGYDKGALTEFLYALSSFVISAGGFKQFFTVGDLGLGQWFVDDAAKMTQCAALIHDDFDNTRQVRVAQIHDFEKHGSWQKLIKLGLVRRYGNSYVPASNDILFFEQ